MKKLRLEKNNPWISFRKSGIHGMGVYAKKDIPKGTEIIEYKGEKITKKESDRRAERDDRNGTVYIFELNKRYDIDGASGGNGAHLINHSCGPNCEAVQIGSELWIQSMKRIRKGEELSYDYGFDAEDFENYPCRCGSKKCRGYIIGEKHYKKSKR